MKSYKKALVAVDIFGGADVVLEKAVDLIKNDSVECVFLNVTYVFTQAYSSQMGGIASPADYYIDINEIEADQLERMKALLKEKEIDGSSLIVESGRPSKKIIEIAERESVDLIVLGSHGRHGVELLLGSTTNAVLHHAKCDVLAVRIQ